MHVLELAWLLRRWTDLSVLAGWPEEQQQLLGRFEAQARQLAEGQAGDPGLAAMDEDFQALYQQWRETGSLEGWEQLERRVPAGTQQLMHVPSITAELARRLLVERGIQDLEQLWNAGKAREIQTMPGLEAKTERTILRELHGMENPGKPVSLGIAREAAQQLMVELRLLPGVQRVEPAGVLRRFAASVERLDLVVQAESPETAAEVFARYPLLRSSHRVAEVLRLQLHSGLTGEIVFCSAAAFAETWWQRTGSKTHVEQVRAYAQRPDLAVSQPTSQSEEALYTKAGLPFVVPEFREGRGEVAAAANGELPSALTLAAVRGDLHMHTDASDGRSTLAAMVKSCQERGYEYMAICDHSRSLVHANGLSIGRLQEQGRQIAELREQLDFPILRGIEVDILLDGTLDYDDQLLANMDIVVASIHSGFQQTQQEIMHRLLSAVKNPHVDFIAHPSGRLVCYREPYAVDMEQLLQACKEYGTALEINAAPERLDLDEEYARQAKSLGIPLVINTDAHHVDHLDLMEYGVHYGRRAWLEPADVLNCWPLAQVLAFCSGR